MAGGWDNGVSPPGGASYTAPLLNFGPLGDLSNDYYQGQFNKQQKTTNDQQQQLNAARIAEEQRKAQIAQAFPNGLPMQNGVVDYPQVAKTFAQFGDPATAMNVMQQAPAPLSPMLGGQQQPGQPAAAPVSGAAPDPTAAKIIQVEGTGKNPKSSADGIGQFTDSTWIDSIKKYFPNLAQGRSDDQLLAMRKIPQLATRVTEAFTADNEAGLTKAGLPVTPATTYLAHFAGLGGAIKVLEANPNTPVDKILGQAAVKANPFLQGMTARELELWAARKMQGPAMAAQNAQPQGGGAPMQVASAAPGDLPPSANAVSPAARPPSAAPASFADRFASAAPQGGQPQPMPQPQPVMQPAPQPQQQPPQAAPAQPQPQGGPITPQVPLPPDPRTGKPFTDPQAAILALKAEAARLGANPRAKPQVDALNDWATRIESSIAPLSVGAQSTIIDPRTGKVLYQGPGAAAYGTAGSGQTLDADAERYRQTGTLPPNMGRGVQGQQESKAIRALAAQKEIEAGGDPTQWPGRWQDFKAAGVGKSAGERTSAVREKNLENILSAANAAIPAALEASKALPRGIYVPLNKLIQKGEIMSSDPRLVEFGMANLQLAEHWARAMNPTGVMRESDRDKALTFLDTGFSNGTYERAVMQLQKQITRERDAVRGGTTILKDGKAPSPSEEGKTTEWVRGPDGKLGPAQ
jgi:hypothetical protein